MKIIKIVVVLNHKRSAFDCKSFLLRYSIIPDISYDNRAHVANISVRDLAWKMETSVQHQKQEKKFSETAHLIVEQTHL